VERKREPKVKGISLKNTKIKSRNFFQKIKKRSKRLAKIIEHIFKLNSFTFAKNWGKNIFINKSYGNDTNDKN